MTMRKRLSLFAKLVIFVVITVFVVSEVNNLLRTEYYYTEDWAMTNTYEDFYRLKKNSVDVLMLGSSHAISSLNPQVIYDNYGITSYNLGSTQQSPLITYYWLVEALKYQSPRVVIIETFTFHKYADAYIYNGMNCNETSVRKAMDSMRFSPLKIKAARDIERYDETRSALSFFLTNIRFHGRWTELSEKDFSEGKMLEHGGMKGFTAIGTAKPGAEYVPFTDADAMQAQPEELVDVAKEYMDKTIELCRQEGIELVFVNIPCFETMGRYRATKEYAEANDVPYIDFNEESYYNALSYNPAEDSLAHPTYTGAEKISNYLGNMLAVEYNVAAREDASYDKSRIVYERHLENIGLNRTEDVNLFLDRLDSSDYSIFVFAPKSFGEYMNDDLMGRLYALGFTCDLRGVETGIHYVAVKNEGEVIEKITNENIGITGSLRNGSEQYSITINTDVMIDSGRTYSMIIAGQECGNKSNGINIVVYDNDLQCIVDKVNIDTSVEERTFSRY